MLAAGTRLGPYEILAPLGAGGMGEVYTARDPRLARTVALKTLTSHRSGADARERFQREARAIAALNHPNICQVYDVGTDGAIDYLVLEYLEGETLADRLGKGPLRHDQLLRCALDVAEALDAAHRRGVVHRDLKPANIFLTAPGVTKVLDFGLAKLVIDDAPDAATAARTRVLTDGGTAVGTVAYMSPEQARGEELDERSDIFSFGAVLYEMATGAPAFSGRTSAVIFKALLDEMPSAPSSRNRTLPARLDDIVAKALEKDRTLRYQSAAEVRADLQRLKRDTESSAGSATAPPPPPRTRLRVALAAGLILALLGAAAGIYYASRRRPVAHSAAWEQLTFFTDAAVYPALSPDGRMLAFIRSGDPFLARGELYVKLLPSGDAVQLTHDGTAKLEPVFTPDGSRIVYGTNNPFDTWEVPVLGGQPVLRWKNASSLSWINGGSQLLFSEIREGFHMVLVTANAARGQARDVYVPPGDRTMVHHSYLSPDGRFVSMVVMNQGGQLGPCELVPFEGAGTPRIVGPLDGACVAAAWTRDGKWIYVSSNHGGAFHIWRQRFPEGPLEQVTSGATEEAGIAMSADGASMLTSVGVRDATIWLHDTGGDHQLSSEGRAYNTRLSTDGSKLYYLQATGAETSLWVRNLAAGTSDMVAGASAIQPGSEIRGYSISRDGTTAALTIADRAIGPRIWLVPLDRRSSPRRIESPIGEDSPVFLPNGDLVVRRTEDGRNYAYRISLAGDGTRRKFTADVIIDLFAASPDGRWLALGRQNKGEDDPGGPMLYPTDGGAGVHLCRILCVATWDITGKYLYLAVPPLSMTLVLPVNAARGIPDLPAGGYTRESLSADKRATRFGAQVEAASGADIYSYTQETTRRNIYRIPLPE